MQAAAPLAMVGTMAAGVATGGAAIPLALGVVGGAMSIAQGASQAGAYKSQAAQYQQQARMVALQAKTDEANRLTQLNQAIGTNRALAASGNIGVDSPTMQALEDANRDIATRGISYTAASATAQEQRLGGAAASATAAAPWAIMGGLMQGASSIYSGYDRYMQTNIPAAGAAF
jgi:hypothetical protein